MLVQEKTLENFLIGSRNFFYKMIGRFLQSSLVLVVIAYALLLCQFALPINYTHLFHARFSIRSENISVGVFFIASTFVFFFFIPFILSKRFYLKDSRSLGLCFPKKPMSALALIIATLIVLMPFILSFSMMPIFQSYYNLGNPSQMKLFYLIGIIGPLYYIFEEFFFRGFLLLNLYQKIGWHSYWVTDILFVIAHFSKPPFEILYAIPAGVLLAFLTVRTKSILPAICTHYCLGITMLLGANHYFS